MFTSSMAPSSPLPAQQQEVSTLVFMHVSIHFMYTFVSLYVLHDTFFTTTCTMQGRQKRGGWGGVGRPTFLPLITNALATYINRVRRLRCCVVQAVLNYCVCPVKPAADRSPGYADETSHTPFSLRARGLALASQSTRYSVHFRRLIFGRPTLHVLPTALQ